MPTDSYFNLVRHIVRCMMRFNMRVGSVITKMTNMQKMNNYEMNTQNIPNSDFCSSYESDSKILNLDKNKLHVCYTDERT